MPYTLTDEQERRLTAMFPRVTTHAMPLAEVVTALIDTESQRRGDPEPMSGAFARNALIFGPVIDKEYDHTTHSFGVGFALQAVVVDPIEMIRINMRYGFAVGDKVIAAIATALATTLPGAKVVRLHGDAFAALLGATSGLSLDATLPERLRAALSGEVAAVLPDDGEPKHQLRWTVAQLDLTVARPSHLVILGPLTYAECERALLLERRDGPLGVQRRELDLQGGV